MSNQKFEYFYDDEGDSILSFNGEVLVDATDIYVEELLTIIKEKTNLDIDIIEKPVEFFHPDLLTPIPVPLSLKKLSNLTVGGKVIKVDKHIVYCQNWLETEAGWGQRSDGYSLHLTEEDGKKYIADYWGTMPDSTPSEYSKPQGDIYRAFINEEEYERLVDKGSLRYIGSHKKPERVDN